MTLQHDQRHGRIREIRQVVWVLGILAAACVPAKAQFIEEDGSSHFVAPSEDQLFEPPAMEALPPTFSESMADWDPEAPVPRFRKSWFQGLQINSGWLDDGGNDGLGISHVEAQLRSGLPLGSLDNILAISPSIRIDSLHGPAMIDVPETLYETGVNFFWMRQLSPRWAARVMVAPMVRSDFTTSEGAFRIFGLGLLAWQWIPDELELSFGVVSLGRDDIPVLPAIGLVWTPTPQWRFDVVFPRPRIAYRLAKAGARSETWLYLSSALGGNTWAVSRTSGAVDELSLRDFRVLLGLEQIRSGGKGYFVEAGWVFARELEYERENVSLEFDDCATVRAGVTF
jgi:hypothetical protein